MFRKFRILILLIILATVGLADWRSNSRLTAWEHSIHVAIYPIAGDNSPATANYIRSLNNDSFAEIAEWMQLQTKNAGNSVLQPIILNVAPPQADMPPLALQAHWTPSGGASNCAGGRRSMTRSADQDRISGYLCYFTTLNSTERCRTRRVCRKDRSASSTFMPAASSVDKTAS